MTGRVHRDSRSEIEKQVAVDIFNPSSSTALDSQGIAAGIARRDQALIRLDHLLCKRTGQRSNQSGTELGPIRGFLKVGGMRGDHGESSSGAALKE